MPIIQWFLKPELKIPHPNPLTYVGQVIRVYREDYRAMSDVYTLGLWATVWDEKEERPRDILVNAMFECDTSGRYAEADATPEVLAKYEAYKHTVSEKRRLAHEAMERNRPAVGKTMKVTRGRKVAKGTIGRVFWLKDGRAGLDVMGQKDQRGYVKDPVWINCDYLEAV